MSAAKLHLPPDQMAWLLNRLPQMRLSSADDRVLLCGKPAMIDNCFAALTARGFDKTTIVREKYLPG